MPIAYEHRRFFWSHRSHVGYSSLHLDLDLVVEKGQQDCSIMLICATECLDGGTLHNLAQVAGPYSSEICARKRYIIMWKGEREIET